MGGVDDRCVSSMLACDNLHSVNSTWCQN